MSAAPSAAPGRALWSFPNCESAGPRLDLAPSLRQDPSPVKDPGVFGTTRLLTAVLQEFHAIGTGSSRELGMS